MLRDPSLRPTAREVADELTRLETALRDAAIAKVSAPQQAPHQSACTPVPPPPSPPPAAQQQQQQQQQDEAPPAPMPHRHHIGIVQL